MGYNMNVVTNETVIGHKIGGTSNEFCCLKPECLAECAADDLTPYTYAQERNLDEECGATPCAICWERLLEIAENRLRDEARKRDMDDDAYQQLLKYLQSKTNGHDGSLGTFGNALHDALIHADNANLGKLAKGYPDQVAAIKKYRGQ